MRSGFFSAGFVIQDRPAHRASPPMAGDARMAPQPMTCGVGNG